MAQRNNTWSLHVHVGVRGADRAIAVCDHLRGLLPALLAVSANSPFLDGRDTGPALGAHRDLHPDLPALRRPRAVRDVGRVRGLRRAPGPHRLDRRGDAAVVERPPAPRLRHRRAADLRRADARARSRSGSPALITACIAQSALDYDDGRLPAPLGQREIEENLWRAIRHGMDGKLIDFDRGEEVPTAAAVERLCRVDRAGPRGARARGRASGGERRPAGPAGARRRGSRSRRSTAGRSRRRSARMLPSESTSERHDARARPAERRASSRPERGGASRADRGAAAHGPGPGPAAREHRRACSTSRLAGSPRRTSATSSRRGSGSRPCGRSSTCSTPSRRSRFEARCPRSRCSTRSRRARARRRPGEPTRRRRPGAAGAPRGRRPAGGAAGRPRGSGRRRVREADGRSRARLPRAVAGRDCRAGRPQLPDTATGGLRLDRSS